MRIGVTDWHGMMDEQSSNAAAGLEYVPVTRSLSRFTSVIKSPINGFLPIIKEQNIDFVEAVISPAITKYPWICSLATISEVLSFSLFDIPLPRSVRLKILLALTERKNFKGFVFWSHAGIRTVGSLPDWARSKIMSKSRVVYPAVGVRRDFSCYDRTRLQFLFSGDFFRKGGIHVVDAFLRLQARFPDAVLYICSDPKIDFNVRSPSLRTEFLEKISRNKNIMLGRIPRKVLLESILPRMTAYLLPTYSEAFGFAVLEALSCGVPVIATTEFALPELIDEGCSGFLIPFSENEKRMVTKGYVVTGIPEGLRVRITEHLYEYMLSLAESQALRAEMGKFAQSSARDKFSFVRRNELLRELYTLN